MNDNTSEDEHDEPLPGTLRFVFIMGACFFIGWVLLYVLMRSRW